MDNFELKGSGVGLSNVWLPWVLVPPPGWTRLGRIPGTEPCRGGFGGLTAQDSPVSCQAWANGGAVRVGLEERSSGGLYRPVKEQGHPRFVLWSLQKKVASRRSERSNVD